MDAWNRGRHGLSLLHPVFATTLAGLLLLLLLQDWAVVGGHSLPATVTSWLAVTVGLLSGVGVLTTGKMRRGESIRGTWLLLIVACGLLLTGEALLTGCLSLATQLPGWLAWPVAGIPLVFAAWCAGRLLARGSFGCQIGQLSGLMIAGGVALAMSWWPAAKGAGGILLTAGCLAAVRFGAAKVSSAEHTEESVARSRAGASAVRGVGTGLLLLAGWLLISHLYPLSFVVTSAAIVLTSLGLLVSAWNCARNPRLRPLLWGTGTVLIVVFPWCFESLVYQNLSWLAQTSSLTGLLVLQAGQLSLWAVCVIGVSQGRRGTSAEVSVLSAWSATGILAGWLMTVVGALPVSILAIGFLLLVLPELVERWYPQTVVRRGRAALVTGFAVVGLLSLCTASPDLARPARLLFTSRAPGVVRIGVRPEQVAQSDAVRLLDSRYQSGRTISTWSTVSGAVETRINGHLIGSASPDTRTIPQPAAEVVTCVLPLVLHPAAGSVLVIDDAVGVGLGVCQAFPLHRIAATVGSGDPAGIVDSNDVDLLTEPAELAVRRPNTAPYDVVIAPLLDPSRPEDRARMTQDWLSAVRRQLNEEGVYCHRLRAERLNEEDLRSWLGLVTGTFNDVLMLQTSVAEYVIVASAGEMPLLDGGVLQRMQRTHVRRQLGQCGWDWCQLAALPVVDSADPVGLWEQPGLRQAMASMQAPDAAVLARRTLWDAGQSASIHRFLAPHQRRLAEAIPSGPDHNEFRRRISAYAQQVEVLTSFPDEPWIYRRSLKSEMTRNQRPPAEVIRKGRIQKVAHPLDEFRKDYLTTLGQLLHQVQEGQLTSGDLRRLDRFAADYEPLVSDFTHHELVRIHELAGHPAPEEEFEHRLHTVYFTQRGDYSVRNVVAALQQLLDRPQLVQDPSQRYEEYNRLVQQLILRWESRVHFAPRSAVRTQRDVDLCVRTSRAALAEMDQLAQATGMTRSEFLNRRDYVARALLGPLRDYGEQILAHRVAHETTGDEQAGGEPGLAEDDVPALMEQVLSN